MPVYNGYQYKPLCAEDEVRFIVLETTKDRNDPLRCSIVQCWPSVKSLENQVCWGHFVSRITPNVNALLLHLRASDLQKHLWIDAICINQADEDEKAQQIPVMGRIYEEATVVHIWLGRADPTTAKLFEFIRKASLLLEVEKMEMAFEVAKFMRRVFGGGGSGGQPGLLCFFDFANRSWFSRRWIIQEACLAQYATMNCGRYSIPLPSLVLAATRFQTLDMSSYPIKVMANLRRPKVKLGILELLWHNHEAQCLLPQDRIAALYSLTLKKSRIHLDYTAPWTELYKQVATSILRVDNNDTRLQVICHLLEFGSISCPGDIDYPSWVPDWRQSRRRVLPCSSWTRTPDTYEVYLTSPGHSSKATITFQHDALQIRWPAFSSRLRARQVIKTHFDSAPDNECKSAEKVLNILNALFPCTSSSTTQLFALSYLLEKIVKFRHSSRDQRSSSLLFDMYIGSIHPHGRPKSSRDGMFDSLRTLGSLLREFCLFKLEPIGLMS